MIYYKIISSTTQNQLPIKNFFCCERALTVKNLKSLIYYRGNEGLIVSLSTLVFWDCDIMWVYYSIGRKIYRILYSEYIILYYKGYNQLYILKPQLFPSSYIHFQHIHIDLLEIFLFHVHQILSDFDLDIWNDRLSHQMWN